MTTLTCADVRDLAPAFVLGALEQVEAAAVRAHLATCPEAHAELAELGGVAGYLAEVVEPVEPPEGLKARILAAAAAEPQGGATAEPDVAREPIAPPEPGPALAPMPAPEPLRPPVPVPQRRPFAFGSFGTWALRAAAVLAIVVLGGATLTLQARLDAAERYAEGVAAVLDVAASPGAQTAILSGGDGGPTGIAAVAADGSVVIAMRDLAPTSGSEVYEAWVIVGDAGPVPIGGFTVGTDGTGTFRATGTAAVAGATLALTREPAPGATSPTLPIVSAGVAVAPPG